MQSTAPMDEILLALKQQNDELDALISDLDEDGWARPSRCEGWSIADVVLHVAQTNEAAVASAQGRPEGVAAVFHDAALTAPPGADVDDLVGLVVAAERGGSGKEVHARWRASAVAQSEALSACDPGARLPWAVGDLSAVTLATTRLAETWIHTGDVAAGLGRQPSSGPHLKPIVRLAWRTLPYAFSKAGRTMAGPVALALTAPDGTPWEFTPKEPALTAVTGPALDFCLVAARRVDAADTQLSATGPDAATVLELVRTFA
jgi:uncharacterized protein (TIGR03084 family)